MAVMPMVSYLERIRRIRINLLSFIRYNRNIYLVLVTFVLFVFDIFSFVHIFLIEITVLNMIENKSIGFIGGGVMATSKNYFTR